MRPLEMSTPCLQRSSRQGRRGYRHGR